MTLEFNFALQKKKYTDMQKPSIPKGTRDFSPTEMVKRNYIFDTIREVFKLHGYLPIETPAMENLSTLLGKYGEEGDKLLFRILNSGDFISGIDEESLTRGDSLKLSNQISEKGLRYDLTVPFARYVVQNRNDITFPFRRYQIQPVWRADRPQKGRYREFYQCDADVIGSDSLLNEAELIQIIDEVFTRLQLSVTIKMNNRKILSGLAGVIGMPEKLTDFTVALDKLDKIGKDKVYDELKEKGFTPDSLEKLTGFLDIKSSGIDNEQVLAELEKNLSGSAVGMKGIEEIRTVTAFTAQMKLNSIVEVDISLARGLNYYTGAIIEVKSEEVEMGSICGGGRYDNLTGIFGLENVSGVGVSFGAERVYDVLESLGRYPGETTRTTDIIFVNFGHEESVKALEILNELRQAGISCEIYPDNAKMKKQFNYANSRGIPMVGIIGEEEIKTGRVMIKNMLSGEQTPVERSNLADYIIKHL